MGNDEPRSPIQKFYRDQTIFITGATGFVGKVLLEKLLYSCEDLRRIYLLVRAKKNKTPEERLRDIFDLPCFQRLNAKGLDYRSKVTLINGDCGKPNLGMDDESIAILIEQVTLVIHAAANVKFNQPLRLAAINLVCTMDLLNLATKMRKLKGFVDISTAYSNCIRQHIKEEFYEPPMTAENFLKLVSSLDDDLLDLVTPKILKNWPNTYVFTKSIIEDLIKRYGKGLPLIIVRPAIIIMSAEEPVPGWIDNFYGIVGLSAGAVLGVIKTIYCHFDVTCQFVPVDYVTNQILAAAWAIDPNREEITIYNFAASEENVINAGQYLDVLLPQIRATITVKHILYYTCVVTDSRFLHELRIFFLHTCFAYMADFVLYCIGREPIAVDNYRRINQQLRMTSHFTTNDWRFESDNVRALWKQMSPVDRRLFNFDMSKLDWKEFLVRGALGARLYLLKDPMETIPRALRKQKLLMVAHYVSVAVFWYLVYKLISMLVAMYTFVFL